MRWLLFSFVCSSLCFANPEGGVVASGEANIIHASKHTLHIHAKDQSIIQWKNFSIEAHELTKFIQPSKHALVLNKVVGNEISTLLGTLEANGQVLLINPNGIIFGQNALIETGGFIASTLDLQSTDFSGELLFKGEGTGSIVNFGTIKAWDGDVTLLSRSIENHGHIEAREGHVNMGAGQEILLQKEEEQRIYIRAHSFEEETGIDNLGTISAIQTELRADGNPYTYAIKHQGAIEALALQEENGRVFLVAEEGVTLCSGTILAPGGTVHILGDRVGTLEKAYVDVSSKAGGGTIFIGGAKQGEDKAVYNANFTTALQGGTFLANATEKGNGGTIIFWADGATRCASHNEAKGGPLGGDGGFIEISGKKYFQFEGAFNDTTAPLGEIGTLLLDPDAQINFDGSSTTTNFNPAPTFTPTAAAPDTLTLGIDAVIAALATNNVIVNSDKPSSAVPGGIEYPLGLSRTSLNFSNKLTIQTGGTGGIVWSGVFQNTGSGEIEFISTGSGIQVVSGATSAAILETGGSITMGTTVTPINGEIRVTSGSGNEARVQSTDGSVSLSPSFPGNVSLHVASSNGNASIQAQDSISVTTDGTIQVVGDSSGFNSFIQSNNGGQIEFGPLNGTNITSIIISGSSGPARVSTPGGTGLVKIHDVTGDVQVTAKSGDTFLSANDSIDINTVTGGVQVTGGTDSLAQISTVNNTINIDVDGTIQLQGGTSGTGLPSNANITSTVGTITLNSKQELRLNGGTDASAQITTTNGSIRTTAELDIALQGGTSALGSPAAALISASDGSVDVISNTGSVSLHDGSSTNTNASIISTSNAVRVNAQAKFSMEASNSGTRITAGTVAQTTSTSDSTSLKGAALGSSSISGSSVSMSSGTTMTFDTNSDATATGGPLTLTSNGNFTMLDTGQKSALDGQSIQIISSTGSTFFRNGSTLTSSAGNIDITAGVNVVIQDTTTITQVGGSGLNITAIGTTPGTDGNVSFLGTANASCVSSTIRGGTSVFFNDTTRLTSTGATGVTIITDNLTPASIRPGAFGINDLASIDTSGAPLAIYTAIRSQNLISTTGTPLNGTTFTPGPQFVNTTREQWGIFFPSGTATNPFTIFYKENDLIPISPGVFVTQAVFDEILVNYIGPFTAELFRILHPFNEYISRAIEFSTSDANEPEEKETLFIRRPSFRHTTSPTMPEKDLTNLSF